jgi:hypothetical protein
MKMSIDRNNLSELILELERQFTQGVQSIEIDVKDHTRSRTLPQNAAIHKYCELMAAALNDSGQDYRYFVENVMKKGFSIPWDTETFKKEFWHVLQKPVAPEAVLKDGTPSTAKLTTEQVSTVHDIVNSKAAEIFGISLPFPDRRG